MTLRDRQQKAAALKYVVARRWFPQIELDVSTYLTTREASLNITDIDVFASAPDEFLGFRGYLIDCKTKKSESAINRALWLHGLMGRMNAGHGMCILKAKGIESDHRYTAAKLGVQLVAESEFRAFADATSVRWQEEDGALADIANWDRFFNIPAKFAALLPAIKFSRSRYWMATDATEACRNTIAMARQVNSELDPAKVEHLAVVGDLLALFTHALGDMVSKIFAGYLQPKEKTELSDALQILFYGGRDSYEQRNRVKRIVAQLQRPDAPSDPLSIPEVDAFTDLVRQSLDAPVELLHAPLFIREAAWAALAGTKNTSLLKKVAREHKHAVRLAVLASNYLRKAAGYPPEFDKYFCDQFLQAQLAAGKP